MIVKLVSTRAGPHYVNERVFVGEDRDHLALAGALHLRVGEWQLLGAALLLAAKQMKGRLEVITEGDLEVVGEPPSTPAGGEDEMPTGSYGRIPLYRPSERAVGEAPEFDDAQELVADMSQEELDERDGEVTRTGEGS